MVELAWLMKTILFGKSKESRYPEVGNLIGSISILKHRTHEVVRRLSLTPALSRWERGNHSPSLAMSWTRDGREISKKLVACNSCFPLPAGEGSRVRENGSIIPRVDFNRRANG